MDESLLVDDGLCADEIGAWGEDKHKLIGLYVNLFATGIKRKWDQRIYIDLYSGSGIARIRGTQKRVLGSPLIALNARDPFDLYIFCESDEEKLDALKERVERSFASRTVRFIHGDCNKEINSIFSEIPMHSSTNKVLSLCLVDPFDIGIKFSTIQKLSTRFTDFLVLLALYMDANRNYAQYLRQDNLKVDEFLGSSTWRQEWEQEKLSATKFPDFLAQQYAKQMTRLNYLDQPLYKMKLVRSDEKNLPLYRMALFSRNQTAYDFWAEVLKYSSNQRDLF